MNPSQDQQSSIDSNQSPGNLNIDYKRVIYRASRYWYWVVLSLIVAVSIAFVRNRYATRIYPVTASIIIKETEETGVGDLLYKNSLSKPYRNYLNELYIIKSYPLIQGVLEDLNFDVSFFLEGNFLTTEAYGYLPFTARVISHPGVGSAKFMFEIANQREFILYPNGGGDSSTKPKHQFVFGDTISYGGLRLIFSLDRSMNVDDLKGRPFIFLFQDPAALAGGYVAKVAASWAEEGAGVIDLKTSGPYPKKDIDFLNGLINRYQQYDLNKKNQAATRTIEFINEQLTDISDSLHQVENTLELFKKNNIVTDLGEEARRVYEKMEDVELEKTSYLVSESYYRYVTDYIRQENNLDQIILPESINITSGILSELVKEMITIQTELKLLNGSELENPFYLNRKKELADARKNIISAIENQRATDKIKLSYLDKQIASLEKQLGNLPAAERRLISIRRNYSLLENLYIFLLQKRSEASISRASSTSDIIVVNPPMQAGGPISPKIRNNYLIALLTGLSIPLAIFVLFELLNTRVQSREDIERITRIPFIGGVGHKRQEDNLEVFETPKSAVAESFRALRSNLNYFLGGKTQGVFLVTSSIGGEGKTFVSINLASVFALSGKKTLIIGADMRKPRIFADFDLDNSVGLSSFLAGLAEFPQIVHATRFDNLSIVSGGPVPPNPSELLLTDKMKEFMTQARAAFDYIIIDTPPLALVTDAFTLSQFADHALFLVRQNYTQKDMLRTAEDFYASGKLKNISVVFNDIYRSGPGYGYGYGYSYGYGYGYGARRQNGNGYYEE